MDTKKITADLIGTGLTQQELADLVPCSQSAICSLLSGKRGTRPSYAIAKRLDELHAERCKSASMVGQELGVSVAP